MDESEKCVLFFFPSFDLHRLIRHLFFFLTKHVNLNNNGVKIGANRFSGGGGMGVGVVRGEGQEVETKAAFDWWEGGRGAGLGRCR